MSNEVFMTVRMNMLPTTLAQMRKVLYLEDGNNRF
jgi:hypothetical protein